MCVPTIDEAGRQRLAQAQREEVEAVRRVTTAVRRRAGLQARVDDADHAVAEAHRHLVDVSGLDRAALLTAMSTRELRRLLHGTPSSSSSSED